MEDQTIQKLYDSLVSICGDESCKDENWIDWTQVQEKYVQYTNIPCHFGFLMNLLKQKNESNYNELHHQYHNEINFLCDHREVKLKYTPDETINQPNMANVYNRIYEKCKSNCGDKSIVLSIKAGCGCGKFYNLIDLFDEKKSVLIVVFRKSLSVDLKESYNSRLPPNANKFVDYLETGRILDEYNKKDQPRLVITINSLHKVKGNYDILVLDELVSLVSTVYGETINSPTYTIYHFCNHIYKSPLVIAMDANMYDELVDPLFQYKYVYKLSNEFKKYTGSTAYMMMEILGSPLEVMQFCILQALSDGKKVVVPTNVKIFAETLKKFIESQLPLINIGLYCGDKRLHCKASDVWPNHDLLIYTPTITAGVSFDEPHFDVLYAYFKNAEKKSCDVSSCYQMLFRSRQLKDKVMYIYCSQDKQKSPSVSYHKIKSSVQQKLNNINVEDLDMVHLKQIIYNNKPFSLYCNYEKQNMLSSYYFRSYLLSMLSDSGITTINITKGRDAIPQSHGELIKLVGLQLEQDKINEIINAKLIGECEFLEGGLDALDPRILKYNLIHTFEIKSDHPNFNIIFPRIVKYLLPYAESFKTLKKYSSIQVINGEIIEFKKFSVYQLYKYSLHEFSSTYLDDQMKEVYKSNQGLSLKEIHEKLLVKLRNISKYNITNLLCLDTKIHQISLSFLLLDTLNVQTFKNIKEIFNPFNNSDVLDFLETNKSKIIDCFDNPTMKDSFGHLSLKNSSRRAKTVSNIVKRLLEVLCLRLESFGKKDHKKFVLVYAFCVEKEKYQMIYQSDLVDDLRSISSHWYAKC